MQSTPCEGKKIRRSGDGRSLQLAPAGVRKSRSSAERAGGVSSQDVQRTATNGVPCERAQRARFHGRWQYLFIESICNDPAVLEQNYRYKMMYSPDYAAASEHVRAALIH